MRSSGGLRWRPGGCSGRDSATLPSVPRRGACSRPPSLCSTTAPDRRRMLADRSVGHACRRTAAHLPDRRRGAWPGTTGGTRLTAPPLTGRSVADMRPSAFRRVTGPRHTTQEHPFEVVIHYPHHPRAGECVVAFRRVIRGGRLHYAIEQTNGCRVLLPAWMTESGAATLPMVEVPRLSLASLRELRGLVDAQGVSSLPSSRTTRPAGGDDGTVCTMATTRSARACYDRASAAATRSDDAQGARESTKAPDQRMRRHPRKNEGGGR